MKFLIKFFHVLGIVSFLAITVGVVIAIWIDLSVGAGVALTSAFCTFTFTLTAQLIDDVFHD